MSSNTQLAVFPWTNRSASVLFYAGLFATLALSFIRFIDLNADFPLGITWSSELYTDEGWYANAAVRFLTSGAWHFTGDFNPAVNMPMGQLLHSLFFSFLGTSLFSARLPEACAFILVIYFTAATVRSYFGAVAGLLTAFLIASNYLGFAYSRLAIMEPIGMAFAAAAIYVATKAKGPHSHIFIVLASILAGAACLTKGTMAFSIPAIAYLGYSCTSDNRARLPIPIVSIFIALLIAGGYQILAKHFYYADYTYFNDINLRARLVTGGKAWFLNAIHQAHSIFAIGKGFLAVTVLTVFAAAISSSKFRRSPLIHALLGSSLLYFGFLSLLEYGPPRYILPLVPLLAGLCAVACTELMVQFRQHSSYRQWAYIPPLMIAGFTAFNCASIATYFATPHYTFVNMLKETGDIIRQREGRLSGVTVTGDLPDSLSLETGIRSINYSLGTLAPATRLENNHPMYALILEHEDHLANVFQPTRAKITKLAEWDVYGNYYQNGKKVLLVGLNWD